VPTSASFGQGRIADDQLSARGSRRARLRGGVGKNKNGEIFFYDTGGDILEDLGTLEYLKQRIIRAHFGDDPD